MGGLSLRMASSDRFPGCRRTSCVISSPLGLAGSSVLDFWVCPSGHHADYLSRWAGLQHSFRKLAVLPTKTSSRARGPQRVSRLHAVPNMHREAPQMVGGRNPLGPPSTPAPLEKQHTRRHGSDSFGVTEGVGDTTQKSRRAVILRG